MKTPLKILITGSGGDIGISIAKIVKQAGLARLIVGCDIHTDYSHELYYDQIHLVPAAKNPDYLDKLRKLVNIVKPELIIPTTEHELGVLLDNGFENEIWGVPLLKVNNKSLQVGLDKLSTSNFLKENQLAYPLTIDASLSDPPELPCIAKAKSSSGSKSIFIINDNWDAEYIKRKTGYIWQQMLKPQSEEYTCCIFRSQTGDMRTLAIRRKLMGGLTGSGEVVYNDIITNYLKAIGQKLNLRGSLNVQLILTATGPVAFEFNAHFSSTVLFRHLMGFKDLEWAYNDLFGFPQPEYTDNLGKVRFYRTTHEYLIHEK